MTALKSSIRSFLEKGIHLVNEEEDKKFHFIVQSLLSGAMLYVNGPNDQLIGHLQVLVDFLYLQTHALDMYCCGDTLGKDADMETIEQFISELKKEV
jgi:hypothetical protein